MEEQQILDAQRLEQQDHVGQVGPLDLWDGGHQHLVFIGTVSVQPARRQTVGRALKTGVSIVLNVCKLFVPSCHATLTFEQRLYRYSSM